MMNALTRLLGLTRRLDTEKIMKKIVSFIVCLFVGSAQASFITSGNIYQVDGGSSVDYWGFSVTTAGTVTFDILSWEAGPVLDDSPITNLAKDLNLDGEIAFLDTHIRLFADNGSLDAVDAIADNDDAEWVLGSGYSHSFTDGSDFHYDSFLSLTLDAGDYILAIGAYNLAMEEAIAGLNDGPLFQSTCLGGIGEECAELRANDHGDYQITWSDNVAISRDPGTAQRVPEPSALLLLGLGMLGLSLSTKSKVNK